MSSTNQQQATESDEGLTTKRPKIATPISTFKGVVKLTIGQGNCDSQNGILFVHEDLITSNSRFLTSRIKPSAPGIGEISIQSKDFHLRDFSCYIDWLYTKRDDLTAILGSQYFDPTHNAKAISWRLIDMWQLGDFLEDERFKNVAMDCVIQDELLDSSKLSDYKIGQIFTNTYTDSALRKWLYDHMVRMSFEKLTTMKQRLSKDMLFELLSAYTKATITSKGRLSGIKSPTGELRCYYHKHYEKDKKCGPIMRLEEEN